MSAILGWTDHEDPELRAAARKTLRMYFTGPPPRNRVRRLKLPGGEESKHFQKIYLNFREIATYEIRLALERLTRGKYDRSIPGKELLRLLFETQDKRRASRWQRRFAVAVREFGAGNVEAAVRVAEEVLSVEPRFPRRRKLYQIFSARAAELTLAGKLRDAVRFFFRAAMILPASPKGKEAELRRLALADAAYVRGLQEEALGRRRAAIDSHRAALRHQPGHTGATVALQHLAPRRSVDPWLPWIVLLLAGAAIPGLLLLFDAGRRLFGKTARQREGG